MRGKYKGLVLLNTITLAIMLAANYAASTGVFSTATVAEISYKYNNLFAPSGYAFSIWGLIFLFCIAFVANQWGQLRNDNIDYIKRAGIWFTISNIANSAWLYCWTNDMIGFSVILILLLLISLCILTVRLRLELDDEPIRTILFVWWPISIYLGWISVATIACIASWLVSLGWRGSTLGEPVWTMTMIAIGCILYLFLIRKRNLREAAAVGIWAFVAIAVRHWNTYSNIALTAIACSAILLVAITLHAYKNRHYNLGLKIKKREWQ